MRIRSIGLATALVALVVAACVGDNPDLDRSEAEKNDAGGGADSGTSAGGDSGADDAGSQGDAGTGNEGGDAGTPPPRVVFVSSAVYTPIDAANGVNAFDKLCNDLAAASPLVGQKKFRAWMSTSTESAAMRTGASTFGGAYKLVDGTAVANSGADLLDGSLLVPINRDERGGVHTGQAPWTGTMADGTPAPGASCGNWKGAPAADPGVRGSTDATSGAWTKNVSVACSGDGPIYCFEVP